MISIVVLSYNHQDYILDTLDSACEVDLVKEIIVIDDGSTDDSSCVIKDYINKKSSNIDIKFIEKVNSGLVKSLNIGLHMAKYENIYFIASDDIICPADFKSLFNVFLESKQSKMIIGNAWIYHANTPCSQKCYTTKHNDFFALSDDEIRKSIFTNFPKPLLLQSAIFKKQALLDVGGWNENLVWDDYPMFVKMISNYSISRKEIQYNEQYVVSKYRQHETNTYKNIRKQISMLEEAFKVVVPANILPKALTKQYAFYLLMAIKNKDALVIKYLLRAIIKNGEYVMFITSFASEISDWVKRKL
ncbi:glycosyltransferase family 2 protein [Buttiauxella sp. B2]|uniref:glycosyltransferase family 2 protein n=1 Tax=Buttiauxella sp. B2 TaxID=2587812 RepID=UPI0011208215|nr:glycosyltransferase family 2 protein [Buttiauxella sp. B2]TNV19001.1 glycosyltransferase family 2 protein [Buttiauxella sp. B2]